MTFTPQGFRFAVTSAGFRKEKRNDVALIVSDSLAVAAATFTKNRFPAAPVVIGREHLEKNPYARAIIINSGQANACTGDEGRKNCEQVLEWLSKPICVKTKDILPASTGVIGEQLHMDKWQPAISALASKLGRCTAEDAAKAIMTTDAFHKISSREISCEQGTVRVLGLAKGAGMICPNMATLLVVLLTDAQIDAANWDKIVKNAVNHSFNQITVDGDTSTNDTVYALANGASGVKIVSESDRELLASTAEKVLQELSYMVVKDGEGASKVARITVTGASSDSDAEQVARTVGQSQLVKTALYGQDANWGRIVAAIGRTDAAFNADDVTVSLCGVELFRHGCPTDTDFDSALAEPLKQRDLSIDISLGSGQGSYSLLAADLGHEYVDCNASYRS